jgi:oxepin-CoA hydrolase / 3-oxo-5,6-dehydrosuberyl-CoA semialdehyde dehydrogenase
MQLESYVYGRWFTSDRNAVALRDATTGAVIANSSSEGMDFAQVLSWGREKGGAALREMTFHQRAGLLKALAKLLTERKSEFYALSTATGATKADSWVDIDGGIGTLFVYASKGARELPNQRLFIDGATEAISKSGTFTAQHICSPLEGAAVQINAFNFPVWGMLEKLAPALLAGVPVIVKPATSTSYLTQLVFRRMIESKLLPEGAIQLVCGGLGDLFSHLTCQDIVSFTGSASTAQSLRKHPTVIGNSVRFVAETDSINSSVLGSDAGAGSPEFDLFVREVVREMTSKAGQKCTAIRKAIVPAACAKDFIAAAHERLRQIVVGDPALESVNMGPLASLTQRAEILERVQLLRTESELVSGDPERFSVAGASGESGAFVPPLLLWCKEPRKAKVVHVTEAFGPVCSVLPYDTVSEAIALARRGEGSLAGSIFTADDEIACQLALGLAPLHGRLVLVNRDCAKESTGHGSPLPHLVHGGPGRAGGGEEMGGIRGVMHYMQRTALQGSPQTLTRITGRWIKGAAQTNPGVHPFRKSFHELRIGDTFNSGSREVTIEDIEKFAALTGDNFYAHMDETAAARNPFFGGRVAHGYFLVSAAAGLFVDPDFGPVLANYGLDSLRFIKPVKPQDRIQVRLTCKQKTLRAEKGYGEVAWDTEITNQHGEPVATYDVLTMVSEQSNPGGT